ncbi:MAG: o-succinylbenzoate synthase, partial [Chloroflexi bacterium]|nr:o-succinylbenzoate synthase [Chloroflexota bacterium]
MKIESIILHHLRMPLVAPFETSFGREVNRECVIVSIRSEGLTGWGECVASRDPGYNYETTGTALHVLKDFIAPLILGKDVKDAVDFQQRVSGIRGHHLAKAGVEMALWDLLGKRDHKSLREMFGGTRDKVEVGVSVGLQESPEVLVRTVTDYVKQGYARVKIKIKPGRDVGDASAVRKAFP